MTEWYVNLDGERGPFSGARLKALADAGKIARDTPVKKGADGQWVVAAKIKGLFSQESSPPPVPQTEAQPESTTPDLPAKESSERSHGNKKVIVGLCGGILLLGVLALGLSGFLNGADEEQLAGDTPVEPSIDETTDAEVTPSGEEDETPKEEESSSVPDRGGSEVPNPKNVITTSYIWGKLITTEWEDGVTEREYLNDFGTSVIRIRGDSSGLIEKVVFAEDGSYTFRLSRDDEGKVHLQKSEVVGDPKIVWTTKEDKFGTSKLHLRNLSELPLREIVVIASLLDENEDIVESKEETVFNLLPKSSVDTTLPFSKDGIDNASSLRLSLKSVTLGLPYFDCHFADATEFYQLQDTNGSDVVGLLQPEDLVEPFPVFIGGELTGVTAATYRANAVVEPVVVEEKKDPNASAFKKSDKPWESKFSVDNIVLAAGVKMQLSLENYPDELSPYSRWSWGIILAVPPGVSWYRGISFSYIVDNEVESWGFSAKSTAELEDHEIVLYRFSEEFRHLPTEQPVVRPVDSILRRMVSSREVHYRIRTGPEEVGPELEGVLSPEAVRAISGIVKNAKYVSECRRYGYRQYQSEWMEAMSDTDAARAISPKGAVPAAEGERTAATAKMPPALADEKWISKDSSYTTSSIFGGAVPLDSLLNEDNVCYITVQGVTASGKAANGEYAFTTNNEPGAHIQIDLGKPFAVRGLYIANCINTKAATERAGRLTVWLSSIATDRGKQVWTAARKAEKEWYIVLPEAVEARYVWIGFKENKSEYLHLRKVKVFGH